MTHSAQITIRYLLLAPTIASLFLLLTWRLIWCFALVVLSFFAPVVTAVVIIVPSASSVASPSGLLVVVPATCSPVVVFVLSPVLLGLGFTDGIPELLFFVLFGLGEVFLSQQDLIDAVTFKRLFLYLFVVWKRVWIVLVSQIFDLLQNHSRCTVVDATQ